MQRLNQSPIELQTIKLLKIAGTSCSINYVAKQLGVAWVTARALLLTLVIEGKVQLQRTTHGPIFWIDNTQRSAAA
jgi:hypothetical protein